MNKHNFEHYITKLTNCTLGENSHGTKSTKARLLLSEFINLRANLLNIRFLPSLKKRHIM